MSSRSASARRVALVGNPNAGKTVLFNALTGLRQRVGNYPGVTVERKEGVLPLPDGTEAVLLDLPGTYSLHPVSPDETMTVEVLLGQSAHTPAPDLVVYVLDATNLERNLYLLTQLMDRKVPMVVALTMTDLAAAQGTRIDVAALGRGLGLTVVPLMATKGIGLEELAAAVMDHRTPADDRLHWELPEPVRREYDELTGLLRERGGLPAHRAHAEAVALLSAPDGLEPHRDRFTADILDHVRRDHEKLEFLGFDRQAVFAEARYAWIHALCAGVVTRRSPAGPSFSDRLDRVVMHRFWGYVVFFGLMAVMFQAIFTWAVYPMELIGEVFDLAADGVRSLLPPGDLRDLLVEGAIAGVAAVVTFLPQIVFLFLFLGVLEDSGYMARAAMLMDRVMGKVGLHGKAFVPLLGSFACAIPGIMAARTIEAPRDRLVTMLVAPLVSCSARLPVYLLLIAAFIPATTVLGVVSLPALTLTALYLSGLLAALLMAALLKKTLLRGATPALIMELPSYRLPSFRSVLLQTWERVRHFLERAGTIILGASIILWFLATYPKTPGAIPAEQVAGSFAGRAGRLLETVIEPLGFDWKIGIGLVTSMLQREVFVSTMGTIYNVTDPDGSVSLQERIRGEIDPQTGRPVYTLLTGLCLMIYYLLAMQCLSTVAVMRKETNGWRWPLFQFASMTGLAYVATFIVYRLGLLIGLEG